MFLCQINVIQILELYQSFMDKWNIQNWLNDLSKNMFELFVRFPE